MIDCDFFVFIHILSISDIPEKKVEPEPKVEVVPKEEENQFKERTITSFSSSAPRNDSTSTVFKKRNTKSNLKKNIRHRDDE